MSQIKEEEDFRADEDVHSFNTSEFPQIALVLPATAPATQQNLDQDLGSEAMNPPSNSKISSDPLCEGLWGS